MIRNKIKTNRLLASYRDNLKNIDIFKIFAYFLVCAFIGWVFETLVVWIVQGKLTDRGYLFVLQPLKEYFTFLVKVPFIGNIPLVSGLPIIELYGFGGVLIFLCFRHLKDQPIKIFIYGMFSMTIFELVSSYICTGLLRHSYWDYSNEFLNFQGRICLQSAIAWGVLSVVAVEFLMPVIDNFYEIEKTKRNFRRIVLVLIIYAMICAIIKYAINPTLITN